jgi:hypothetical protein
MLPRPFSTVCITFGDSILLPPAGPEVFEQQRRDLETLFLPRLFHFQKE